MAKRMLDSTAVGAFCESLSYMLGAGIQTDEAVYLLSESKDDSDFKQACLDAYRILSEGGTLSYGMKSSGMFPSHAVDMVQIGEGSGRLEDVLRSLGTYYAEEARLVSKVRSSIGYPAVLLCVMAVILAFTIGAILPIFDGVYQSVAGGLTASSFEVAALSAPIAWIALAITVVCAVIAVACLVMVRSEEGRERLNGWLEHVPFTRDAMESLALSRFVSVLSVYIAAGYDMDHSMEMAVASVHNRAVREKAERAYADMVDPEMAKGLVQAIVDCELLDPIYARMLTAGARVGDLDEVLDGLSATFFNESVERMDRIIEVLEPAFAAFMTVAVGVTLIAVMLPLIGIMGSMG